MHSAVSLLHSLYPFHQRTEKLSPNKHPSAPRTEEGMWALSTETGVCPAQRHVTPWPSVPPCRLAPSPATLMQSLSPPSGKPATTYLLLTSSPVALLCLWVPSTRAPKAGRANTLYWTRLIQQSRTTRPVQMHTSGWGWYKSSSFGWHLSSFLCCYDSPWSPNPN